MRPGIRLQVLLALALPLAAAVALAMWALPAIVATGGASTAGPLPVGRMLVLFLGVGALLLLVLLYAAVTRLVVRPLDGLKRAAFKVASGARTFDAPRGGGAEVAELGESLREMTTHLLDNERALALQVEQARQANEQLRQTQDQLVRAERLASVGQLAAGVAHEIGNPVAAALGLQELLLAGHLQPDQRDFVERMQHETQRVHRIVRSLLDVARPHKAARGKSIPGSVDAAMTQTLGLLRPQKLFYGVRISVGDSSTLPTVALSTEELSQVFLNVVLNAGHAVQMVEPAEREVRITFTPDVAALVVTVDDTGPGFRADVMPRVFEPFVTTKEVGQGTGLGLSVCRGLIDAVGGRIEATNLPERGARVVLTLPIVGRPSERPPSELAPR